MAGKLSTHVLDTAHGRPATGVAITLWRRSANGEWQHLLATATNTDGRTDAPLLAGADLLPGIYELRFQVGAYFAAQGETAAAGAIPFLDEIPVRFGLADATANHHVPLLVTPWSYGTYRGS
jgi:5-hydroxyisourate hydrolase